MAAISDGTDARKMTRWDMGASLMTTGSFTLLLAQFGD
jgi:hypothetical protein